MTDKEVGELWQDLQLASGADLLGKLYWEQHDKLYRETLLKLIRKLVHERAYTIAFWHILLNEPINLHNYISNALNDFEIPIAEYNNDGIHTPEAKV